MAVVVPPARIGKFAGNTIDAKPTKKPSPKKRRTVKIKVKPGLINQ